MAHEIGDIRRELDEIRQWKEEMETVLKDLSTSVQNLIEDLSKVQIMLGEMKEETVVQDIDSGNVYRIRGKKEIERLGGL